MLWLRGEDPKVIMRVINFELVHHGTSASLPADGRIDGRLTIAVYRALHYVHRAVMTASVTPVSVTTHGNVLGVQVAGYIA